MLSQAHNSIPAVTSQMPHDASNASMVIHRNAEACSNRGNIFKTKLLPNELPNESTAINQLCQQFCLPTVTEQAQ